MKSNRLTFHAGALAVAIAIMALPGFTASARAQTPAAADSTVHADSTTVAPAPAPATPVPAPSDTVSPARMPADTSAAAPPPQMAPAPTSAPAAAPAPAKPRKEKKARPVKVKTVTAKTDSTGARDPWARGTNWVMTNFGYARSGEPGAAPGGYGFGLAVRRMLTNRWSAAVSGGFDQLGRFDTAKEWEYPFTVSVARHFKWKTAAKPYFELGYGAFRHSFRGTGQDTKKTSTGTTFTGGIDVPTGGRGIVGAYARYEYVNNKRDVNLAANPVFGGERNFAQRYAIRLTWSILL